ncbi:MAG TPA: hypothetical protein VGR26_08520, partial [Acidimicrobiales bacterium]|nr:hypothetical protein [Acidimicrobiales bacterium]
KDVSITSDPVRNLRVVVATILAVSLLAACGGGNDGDSSGDGAAASEEGTGDGGSIGDPCGLLTNEEITAATDLPVIGSQHRPPSAGDSPFDTCDWELDGGNFETLRLSISPADQAREYFDAGKTDPVPIPDLGDEAYWEEHLTNINVIEGNFSFSIQPLLQEGKDRRAAAEALARNVLANAS